MLRQREKSCAINDQGMPSLKSTRIKKTLPCVHRKYSLTEAVKQYKDDPRKETSANLTEKTKNWTCEFPVQNCIYIKSSLVKNRELKLIEQKHSRRNNQCGCSNYSSNKPDSRDRSSLSAKILSSPNKKPAIPESTLLRPARGSSGQFSRIKTSLFKLSGPI